MDELFHVVLFGVLAPERFQFVFGWDLLRVICAAGFLQRP
jgi:hypothetical protein